MPSINTIIKMIRQESPARLEMGTVVSTDTRGIRQVTVRLSGGRTVSRLYMCVDDLEVGDPVIVAHMEGLDRMVVISRVLDAYSSDLAKHGVLAPPANLAVTGYPMAIHTEWENYPGEGLSYIVEESDDGGATGTQMLVTQGSYYLHLCTVEADHAPETWHFRARTIRWLGDNNIQYSGWSDWTSGTSKTWDARYYTETELSSADCDGLHGASLIWICDADDNFSSNISTVELALDYLAETGGGAHDLFSATHSDTVAQAVARGDLAYGNATPAWDVLSIGAAATILRSDGTDPAWVNPALHVPVPPVAQGDIIYADGTPAWVVLPRGNTNFVVRISGGNIPEWVDPQLEIPIACAAEGQVIRSDNLPKWEATTTPHWPGQWSFAAGLDFDGVTAANALWIPDNVADALEIADSTTGDEYLGFRTAAQKAVIVNEDGADIDFIVEATGVTDALIVQGSDGQITLGVLGAGHLSTSAGGVVSASANIVTADDAWIGLGGAGGRIWFDSTPAPDEIHVADATLIIDSNDILPGGVGQQLGSPSLRWDVYAWLVDLNDGGWVGNSSTTARLVFVSGFSRAYFMACNLGVETNDPPSRVSVNGDLALVDGMTAPGTTAGWAKIYVDTADGDLKVKFGDGHVAVVAADS